MVAVERPGVRELVRAIDLPLLGFVLGLGIIVRGVADHGLGDLVSDLLPRGHGVLVLLATAVIAAVLANLLRQRPGAARPAAGRHRGGPAGRSSPPWSGSTPAPI
jgi:Na+/H+ antiporter NhaD/arsenite permease-like protein